MRTRLTRSVALLYVIALSLAASIDLEFDPGGLLPSLYMLALLAVYAITGLILLAIIIRAALRRTFRLAGTAILAGLALLILPAVFAPVIDHGWLALQRRSITREAAAKPGQRITRQLHEHWSDWETLVYDPSDAEAQLPGDWDGAEQLKRQGKTECVVYQRSIGDHFYDEITDCN